MTTPATYPASPARLGDILVAQGSIARSALEEYAARARGRIGDYLHSHSIVSGLDRARALATQQRLPFIAFETTPPQRALFNPRDLPHYIAHRYVPHSRNETSLTVATSEPSAALQTMLTASYGMPVHLLVTGPRDLETYFATIGATTATRQARLSLRRRYRHLVADRTLLPAQAQGLLIAVLLTAAALYFVPQTTWRILLLACNLFYLVSLYVKMQLFKQGYAEHRAMKKQLPALQDAVRALDAAQLPVYTILVPLYMETPEVMARLIANLSALDYPCEKLDIKLICEADDRQTLDALKTLRPPQTMQIIAVPPSTPRTKPKACNVALQQIRGEYLVIYDAEDAPAPDQLKCAVAMFRRQPETVACLQAALNYYNRAENLLTKLFAIEYSALFHLNLPALQRMRMPIPLGGTSNHLRVSALLAAGGWDAFNVTEDADLGIRLAYFGYETRVLPSLTLEEAPITLGAWMKQRTRWIKGYIQTWLVYMRNPAELKRRLGPVGYYGFQFFVGAPALTFLLAPCFWVICFVSFTGYIPGAFSPYILVLCAVSFLGGVFSNWIFARAVLAIEAEWTWMHGAMLVYPLYWLLHSVAAGLALWQLAFRPHYWGKTRHGLTRFKANWQRKQGEASAISAA